MGLKVLLNNQLQDRVCVVVGTRPSLIKQAPIIRELQRQQVPFFVIHTGQHYSYELDRAFFIDLQLPEPDHRLKDINKCKLHGEQTGEMLKQLEAVLVAEKPRAVVVGGDANSNLAGALAARKLNLLLAHDESGLRSYKWHVPEEHNRVIMDHIADYLFVPNERAKKLLERECVMGKIFITGTTISDAIAENLPLAKKKSTILQDLKINPNGYIVMTLHHEENVDYKEELTNLMEGVIAIGERFQVPVIFPIHPRTRLRLKYFDLEAKVEASQFLKLIVPVGYFDFLMLIAHSKLIMTDSGGLTQEAAILKVPCLTLGRYTDWTETVDIGANMIGRNDPDVMVQAAAELIGRERNWPEPFGPPGAAKRIVEILKGTFAKQQVS